MDQILERLAKDDQALKQTKVLITHEVSLYDGVAVQDAYRQFDEGRQIKVIIRS